MAEDFLNLMKQTFTQGMATVNQQIDAAKHQLHVESLNRQIREEAEKLGRTVYENWSDNTLDTDVVRMRCETMRGLLSQKTALEEEIQRLRSHKPAEPESAPHTCPACGTVLPSEARFCMQCGHALDT